MAELPDWQSLENAATALFSNGGRSGGVVAIYASNGAMSGGWAASAAMELATALGSEGQRVALVDGAIGNPTLHLEVGIDNFEGLTDAAFYGVSVGRIVRTVDDLPFFLITAGSPVADPGALTETPRWRQLLDGFAEAGVTILLFLRADAGETEPLLSSADEVVVLADQDEAIGGGVGSRGHRVRAVLGPSSGGRSGRKAEGADARVIPVSTGQTEGPATQVEPRGGDLEPSAETEIANLAAAAAAEEAEAAVAEIVDPGSASASESVAGRPSAPSELRPPAAAKSSTSGGRRNIGILVGLLVVLALAVAYAMGFLG